MWNDLSYSAQVIFIFLVMIVVFFVIPIMTMVYLDVSESIQVKPRKLTKTQVDNVSDN